VEKGEILAAFGMEWRVNEEIAKVVTELANYHGAQARRCKINL
jgi:hypothetical protein